MKKLATVLVLALVASFAFAGFSAGLSVGFDTTNGYYKYRGNVHNDYEIKDAYGLSFAADLAYEFEDYGILVFDDFAFAPFAKEKAPADSENKFSAFKNYAGVGYVLPFDTDVKLVAGLSFVINSITEKFVTQTEEETEKYSSLGAAVNLKASYEFAEGFSAFVAGDFDLAFSKAEDATTLKFVTKAVPCFGVRLGAAYNF